MNQGNKPHVSINTPDLEPAVKTTTIAKLHRQLRERLKTEWVSEWATKLPTGRYAIADRTPPSLAGSYAFRALDRRALGVVTKREQDTDISENITKYITYEGPSVAHAAQKYKHANTYYSNVKPMRNIGT